MTKPRLYYVPNPKICVVSFQHDNDFYEHIVVDDVPWDEDGVGFNHE
jgi:hypothetical protein